MDVKNEYKELRHELREYYSKTSYENAKKSLEKSGYTCK